ncbi:MULTISPECIES: CDP-alcohol phosphatidyltransferase family protein [unclassified Clostridium]|uniref:CDP-alcohol phosphatidyltransferase family protein n=1 Tax=Clostridium sulfidigenes TaxID=318464 RepID=A0A927ZLK7_9CLOT|nr:CDP-alcohol phosphatidyltransferase family protein [Clostridium sulfidigenes]
MLDTRGRKYFDRIFDKIGRSFLKIGFMPTHITIIAAMVGIVGAVSFSLGKFILSIILLWISGFLDAVDGSMARQSGKVSEVGTLLDIWLDRLVEISYIISFAIVCNEATFTLMILACTIILSMTVFLTSGMLLENTGIKSFHYQAGLMERTEGFIMFTFMIIFYPHMKILAFIYAVLILYTAVQRLYMAIKVLGGNNEK